MIYSLSTNFHGWKFHPYILYKKVEIKHLDIILFGGDICDARIRKKTRKVPNTTKSRVKYLSSINSYIQVSKIVILLDKILDIRTINPNLGYKNICVQDSLRYQIISNFRVSEFHTRKFVRKSQKSCENLPKITKSGEHIT